MLAVRFIDNGFVVPSSVLAREPTAEINVRYVQVPELEQLIQYVVVAVDGTELAMLLVYALEQTAVAHIESPLSAHFKRQLVFVREDREGFARVECTDVTLSLEVAAAVAVMKASYSWDESQPIVVEMGVQTLHVTPEFRDGQWFADVNVAT